MQSTKEVLDLLTKATNMRLNSAIFIVSLTVVFLASKEVITLEKVSEVILRGLIFVTVVRLTYGGIGLIFDFFHKRQEKKIKQSKAEEESSQAEAKSLKEREAIRSVFETLDIFQLYVIQELKRQNHVQIKKGAPLFTLKSFKIIYSPAVEKHYESASLTDTAKYLLENELWCRFDEFKFNALVRFFEGIQPEDAKYFQEFLESDSINTLSNNNYGKPPRTLPKDRVYSNYTKSIIFTQPQRGYIYNIDPIAKAAIEAVNKQEIEG